MEDNEYYIPWIFTECIIYAFQVLHNEWVVGLDTDVGIWQKG